MRTYTHTYIHPSIHPSIHIERERERESQMVYISIVHQSVPAMETSSPGDCRGCAEPDEPMGGAMQLRLPRGRRGEQLPLI